VEHDLPGGNPYEMEILDHYLKCGLKVILDDIFHCFDYSGSKANGTII